VSDRISSVTLPAVTRGRKLIVTVIFGAILILVLVLQVVALPEQTRLWKEFLNAGHVLLFGVVSILALWASMELFRSRLRERYQHYLLALAVTVAIGAASEILQIWAPRDANLADFARNVAGAACFLGFYSTHDPRLIAQWKNKVTRKVVMAASITTLLAAFVPLFSWTAAYTHRVYAFPEIVSFGSYWSRLFLEAQDADLTIADPPQDWTAVHSDRVGRLTLKLARYPGLWVQEPYPDWSSYSVLRIDIYSEMRSPVQLVLRIHDWQHNNAYADRFNYPLTVLPGANAFKIPMETIRNAPARRELDMHHIAALALFALNPKEAYTIDIDGLWLE
jgi:hypothetical protein